jgi:hypothetical protein
LPSAHHLHWPDLDIDLAVESLRHPERYPLISQAQPSKRAQPTKVRGRVSQRNPGPLTPFETEAPSSGTFDPAARCTSVEDSVDRNEAVGLFEERFGELVSAELFRRLLLYFESMA